MEHSLNELLAGLASPDPAVRDGWAYEELAEGLRSGRLVADHDAIRASALASLTSPQVQARAFAPLVLRWLLLAGDRDRAGFEAVARWYVSEPDCRGYDEDLGWLHAVAHGADYLATAAVVGVAEPTEVLALLARRCTTPGPGWTDQENARLAQAVLQSLASSEQPLACIDAFTEPVAEALTTFEDDAVKATPGRPPSWLSNTYVALATLYMAAGEQPALPAGTTSQSWGSALQAAVGALASRMTPWLFTPRGRPQQ